MRTADGGMPVLEIEVVNSALERLPDDVILALAYGPGEESVAPGVLQTGLSTLDGVPALEVWRTSGAVTAGVDGPARHCANREFLCGIIDLDESRFRGIADAAESAYRWIRDLHAQVDETIANLRELHRAGGGAGEPAGLKVYLRNHAGATRIAEKIRAGLSAPGQPLLIAADICRRELLVEIECLWT
jgi:hypothetical protein